jgi:hypothetical protein
MVLHSNPVTELTWAYQGALTKIPLWLRMLKKLTHADLAYCDVKEIKGGSFPASLEGLNMKNQFAGLRLHPDSFEGLSMLEWLDINTNKLTEDDMHPGLFGDTKLEHLNIMGNPGMLNFDAAALFPGSSGQHLEELYLTDNADLALPEGIFSELCSLKLLRVDGVGSAAFTDNAFAGWPHCGNIGGEPEVREMCEAQQDIFVEGSCSDQQCESGECPACKSEGTCGSNGFCSWQGDGDGGGSCTTPACGMGEEPNMGEGRCDACEAGKYSDSVDDGSCAMCAGGKYSESVGSADCEECDAGKTSFMGASECVAGTIKDTADHAWDFRGCTDGVPIVDDADGSELQATLRGAECSAEGVRLNGFSSFVEIDTWEFGGALSIEMYVKHGAFNHWSKVLDFGSADPLDNVVLANWDSSSGINWAVARGTSWAGVDGVGDWELGVWQHIVATVQGADMKVWKDGVLVASVSNGYEPRVLTRSRHRLGRFAWANYGYVLGEIGYLRMWHGAGLEEGDVQALYNDRDSRE